jgi:hypothetical protein
MAWRRLMGTVGRGPGVSCTVPAVKTKAWRETTVTGGDDRRLGKLVLYSPATASI